MKPVRAWATWLGANLVYVAFHPWLADGASPARSVAIMLAWLILPAWGWPMPAGTTRAGPWAWLATLVVRSTTWTIAVLVVTRIPGVTPGQVAAWNILWLVTNAGFASAWRRRRATPLPLLARSQVLPAAVAFLGAGALYSAGAARIVPPQVDHDLEAQATGYGLITRLEPLLLTDRHTTYYFAHPPLLHLYVAGSFLLHGALPALEPYDAASRRARDAMAGRPIEAVLGDTITLPSRSGSWVTAAFDDSTYQLTALEGGSPVRESVERVELARIYGTYQRQPRQLETRAPSILLAALTVTLLALHAGHIARRPWLGVLVAATYATSPEVVVRSSYGGYFAIGAFFSVLMLLAFEHWRGRPGRRAAALPIGIGALAALSDHKLVILPLAMALVLFATHSPGGHGWAIAARLRRAAAHPVVAGFLLGTALYWAFGLAIAPGAFLEDHVRSHLVDRVTHTNPLGYGGYATPLGVWMELVRHTGYLLVPVALLLLARDLWRPPGGPHPGRPARELWLVWLAIGAVAFTVIDWRMTKHLMPLLIPLHLALVPSRRAPAWRVILPVATMVVLLAWNAWTLGAIWDDFASFRVTPAW